MLTNRSMGLHRKLLLIILVLVAVSLACDASFVVDMQRTQEAFNPIMRETDKGLETQSAHRKDTEIQTTMDAILTPQELRMVVGTPVTPNPSMTLTPQELQRAADTPVPAPETLLYNNWHSEAACEFGHVATFHLDQPALVTRFDLWIFEQEKASTLAYTLTDSSGAGIPTGSLTNMACDPYYKQYCQFTAVDFNQSLPAGDYTITLDNVKVCESAASGHTGYIKVWGH